MLRAALPLLVRATLAAVLLAAAGGALAQSAGKKNTPITRQWECANGRVVTINYHPFRIKEPAWLTYFGNRHEVSRKRVDQGIAASSADGKVQWHEIGSNAMLQYAGLLEQPISCSLKASAKAPVK
jgi:hypothetical protein